MVPVIAARGLDAFAILTVLAVGVPWEPLVINGSSYEYQLHLGRVFGFQWGVDLAATYGPWGFVGLSLYHPETFHWMVLLNGSILCLTALRICVFVARILPGARWATGFFMAACLLPLTTVVVHEWTAVLFCPQVLAVCIVLEWLAGRPPSLAWVDALTAAAFGFFTLVKISVWSIALMVCIASWFQPGPRRWTFTACLGGAVLVGWLSAGQSLLHLGAFVRTGLDVIGGFKNGMPLWYTELQAGVLLLGAVLGLMALLAWLYWPRSPRAVIGFLALGGVFGQILQGGLVRADLEHLVPTVMAVLSILPLLLAAAWAAGRWRGHVAAIGMLTCSAALFWLSPGTPDYPRPGREARAFVRFLREGARPLQARRETWLSHLHDSYPLDARELTGRGGILGGDPAILESHSTSFTLQPTLTTYASYTPMLQAFNADWIANPARLAWLLWCSPKSADIRYPGESDGRTYIALLTHFTFERRVGSCVLLERTAPRPLRPQPESPQHHVLLPGQMLTLAPSSGGVIWAEVTLQETWLGKVVRGFLKPAPLVLHVRLRNGGAAANELLPTMTSQGFPLSPYLGRWQALEAAARGTATGESVSAFRITAWALGPVSSDLFYEPEIQVTLTSLSRARP